MKLSLLYTDSIISEGGWDKLKGGWDKLINSIPFVGRGFKIPDPNRKNVDKALEDARKEVYEVLLNYGVSVKDVNLVDDKLEIFSDRESTKNKVTKNLNDTFDILLKRAILELKHIRGRRSDPSYSARVLNLPGAIKQRRAREERGR